jgi:hypothetical protein
VLLVGAQAGKQTLLNTTTAIIDSGTSLIVGPEKDVATLALSFGAYYSYWEGVWLIDCNQAQNVPTLNFKIGGKTYSIEVRTHESTPPDRGTGERL